MSEDSNGIALEALKKMRGVLRDAMAKMPEEEMQEGASDSPEEESAETKAMDEGIPAMDEALHEEMSDSEPAPDVGKMTVLETITPKSSRGVPSAPPPPMKRGPGRPKGSGKY